MELVVTRISEIDAHAARSNDGTLQKNEQQNFDAYMKDCYRQLNISYPKFYKMDRLSKLCFIAAELLLKDHEYFEQYDREKICVILENHHSSIDADIRHFDSIKSKDDYFPSPAVFVYTLPNIMVGELCIRHHITGEGSCFLLQEDEKHFMKNYIASLFLNEGYQCCITGKVDYIDGKYEAKLYLIEKRDLVEKHILKFDSIF
jgi:hypothetical protein